VDNGRILGAGISNTPLLRGVDVGFCHIVLKCGYWGEKNWSCCLVMDGCMTIGDIVTVV